MGKESGKEEKESEYYATNKNFHSIYFANYGISSHLPCGKGFMLIFIGLHCANNGLFYDFAFLILTARFYQPFEGVVFGLPSIDPFDKSFT